jgi:hypothetical protein
MEAERRFRHARVRGRTNLELAHLDARAGAEGERDEAWAATWRAVAAWRLRRRTCRTVVTPALPGRRVARSDDTRVPSEVVSVSRRSWRLVRALERAGASGFKAVDVPHVTPNRVHGTAHFLLNVDGFTGPVVEAWLADQVADLRFAADAGGR